MKKYKAPLDRPGFDLANGRWIAPGEEVHLSDEDALLPHNAANLAEGRLLPVSEKGEKVQDKAERAQRQQEGGS